MPKPKMPDGLYVSVSQMKTWLTCPRRFSLRYVEGVAPEFIPVPLAFGSAIHAALAAYYGEIKTTGVPLRRDLVLDTFRASWAAAAEGDVPLQADEDDDPRAIIDKGVAMLNAFHAYATEASPFTVDAVEHRFVVPLFDPDTGVELDEALMGVMDLVLTESDGRKVIVEHKTSSRKYGEEQLRFDLQVTGYQLAARAAGMGEVGLRYQVITKTKVPAIQIANVVRDEGDEKDFLRTAVGVLKAIDAGASFPIRGWQCRGCPYASRC